MDLWRISNFSSLDGRGGELYSARWNTRGQAVVYLAATPAGALLEVLVHLELNQVGQDDLPRSYNLMRIAVPTRLPVRQLHVNETEWTSNLPLTRALGDSWLKSRKSALARIPSAILPQTFNFLLNPLHANAAKITVAAAYSALFDTRLIR